MTRPSQRTRFWVDAAQWLITLLFIAVGFAFHAVNADDDVNRWAAGAGVAFATAAWLCKAWQFTMRYRLGA